MEVTVWNMLTSTPARSPAANIGNVTMAATSIACRTTPTTSASDTGNPPLRCRRRLPISHGVRTSSRGIEAQRTQLIHLVGQARSADPTGVAKQGAFSKHAERNDSRTADWLIAVTLWRTHSLGLRLDKASNERR